MKKKIIKTDGVMMNVQRLLENAPVFPRNVARAYILFYVNKHRKISSNMVYVNFDAKDGDHVQIYYIENRPEKIFRFFLTAYLFGWLNALLPKKTV